MADPRVLHRSNSYSRSEASDAGSTSSKWEQDDPVADSPPVVSSASPTRSSLSTLPPSSPAIHPTAHTLPTVTGSGPQPGTSDATVTSRVQPASRPPLELNAGVLAINKIDDDNTDIRDLLVANPGIHSVLIQTEQAFSSMSMIDLFGQFVTISSLATLKFDFVVHRGDRPWPMPDLDQGCCKALTDLLANNSSLRKLDFSDQAIFELFLGHLASGLGKQTTLKVLDLSDSRRAGPRNSNMVSSELMGKMGKGIAAIISTSSGLSSLLASRQSIDDEDALLIAGALKKTPA